MYYLVKDKTYIGMVAIARIVEGWDDAPLKGVHGSTGRVIELITMPMPEPLPSYYIGDNYSFRRDEILDEDENLEELRNRIGINLL